MTEKKIPGVLLVAIGLFALVSSYQFAPYIDMTVTIILGVIIAGVGTEVIILDEYPFLVIR